MGKSVNEMVSEFNAQPDLKDSFGIYVLSLNLDTEGNIVSTESTKPVTELKMDLEHNEFLLLTNSDENQHPLTISDVKNKINNSNLNFEVCMAEETTLDDSSWVRVDTPLIGFGENLEQNYFFCVCQAVAKD